MSDKCVSRARQEIQDFLTFPTLVFCVFTPLEHQDRLLMTSVAFLGDTPYIRQIPSSGRSGGKTSQENIMLPRHGNINHAKTMWRTRFLTHCDIRSQEQARTRPPNPTQPNSTQGRWQISTPPNPTQPDSTQKAYKCR